MAVVALKPRRGYSFTDHAVANPAAPPPGDRLDGEVDRIDRALAQIIDWVSVSLNSDGTLKFPPPSVSAASTAAVGVLGGNETHSIPGADPNALAMDWAEVSAEWAEHMPDTIPGNILAVMGVTGDHWSSRWWANRAAQLVSQKSGLAVAFIGADPPPLPTLGSLWWDNVGGNLYIYYNDLNSDQWVVVTNQPQTTGTAVTIAEDPPTITLPGGLWFDSSSGQLYIKYTDAGSTQWVPVVNQMVHQEDPANVIAPASGATVVLPDIRPVYVNNPAPLAALTLRLPAAILGQSIEIGFKSPVTVLTLQDVAGAAIPGAPTSASGPGAAIEMRYDTPGWIYW
jgi:hypothetical protein